MSDIQSASNLIPNHRKPKNTQKREAYRKEEYYLEQTKTTRQAQRSIEM